MEYVQFGTDVYKAGLWTKSLHAMINHISRATRVPFDENTNAYEWFSKHVILLEDPRTRKLFESLEPIQWSLSSSISFRKNLVRERLKVVELLMPFLTDTERRLVAEWKKENKSSELWD